MTQPFCPQMLCWTPPPPEVLDPHTMTVSLHSSSTNPLAVLVRYQRTRRSISYLLSFPRIPKSMIGQKALMKSRKSSLILNALKCEDCAAPIYLRCLSDQVLSKNGLRILRALDQVDQVTLSSTLLAVVNSNHRRDCCFLRDLVASQGEKFCQSLSR
jgi:hypothetical protein